MTPDSAAIPSGIRVLLLVVILGHCVLPGCEADQPPAETPATRVVRVTVTPGSQLDLQRLTFDPADAVHSVLQYRDGSVDLLVDAQAVDIALVHPETCPARVGPETEAVTLRPWIDTGPPRIQLGYDTVFEVQLTPGCQEATGGTVTWEQVAGAPLPSLRPQLRGLILRGRTVSWAEAMGAEAGTWGIVPVSPRTQGRAVLRATFALGNARMVRELEVAAAARATGLPSLAQGQRVYLDGEGWSILESPKQSATELQALDGRVAFMPDTVGTWRLVDAAGRELAVTARRHDRTRLDCARSECHGNLAQPALESAMSTVWQRGLNGDLGDDYDPGCALRCHTTGDPGLGDGGYGHVALELEHGRVAPAEPAPGGWAAQPRALRRLGGVGCTACHGPAAIPERSARWAVLRADVCAVCHDAPPDYTLVSRWRESAMATSDARVETRADDCSGCHTTAGFLAAIGARTHDSKAPLEVGPIGVACAACHAPHGPSVEALVRTVPLSGVFGDAGHTGQDRQTDAPGPAGAWQVCIACHAPAGPGAGQLARSPADTQTRPSALPNSSASALLLGVGGWQASGAPLEMAPVHLGERGCLDCHGGTTGHSFAVVSDGCATCHTHDAAEEQPDPGGPLLGRAENLWQTLERRGVIQSDVMGQGSITGSPGTPNNVHPAQAKLLVPADSLLGKAAWNVGLVRADKAAAMHHAAYGRALLDAAEQILTP